MKLFQLKPGKQPEEQLRISLYTLTMYHTQLKIMIQGNYKDQWKNDEFEKLRSIVSKVEEGDSMVETYNRCLNTEVEIELIDLENQEIINCDLLSAAIANHIDIPSDTLKTIQDIITPIRKAKHVVGLKYFKTASRDAPGKTPGKVSSDLQISDTEIATKDEIKNAKDEISSPRKTIENIKRSIPNEQMIDQIIKDEVNQRIEDLKYSYKTDLKLLKESFNDKLNELATEYNKLKHEKLSLEGKINTLTGSYRSLEQENKALKDTISALSENLHEHVTNCEVKKVIKDIANIQDELGSLGKLIASNSISLKQELDVLTMKVSDNRSHDQSVRNIRNCKF